MLGVRQLLVCVVLIFGSVGYVWANLAPLPQHQQPDAAKSGAAPLAVFVDHHQAQTRLLIPRKLLASSSEFQPLPAVTPSPQSGGSLRGQTVAAGLTLSLLLAGGGAVTVLVRRRRGRAALVTSVAVLVTLGVYVNWAVADLVPQPANGRTFNLRGPYSREVPSMSPLSPNFSGSLVIQPVERGDRVTLIIGRDLAGAFSQIKTPPVTPAANRGPGSASPQ